jgi:hypothetical protein
MRAASLNRHREDVARYDAGYGHAGCEVNNASTDAADDVLEHDALLGMKEPTSNPLVGM